jgi:hypothetical protein
MKQLWTSLLIAALAASLALSQSSPAASSTPKKATGAKKKTVSSKNRKTGKGAAGSSSYASRQSAPTPERYKEIQQALADKGYLKSAPNGVWDAQSMDALRQFQTDQKLSPTGKLSSASLIALGLGPKTAPPDVKPPLAADPPSPPLLPAPPPASRAPGEN